jgi:RNase H-fold protein (predicted Holliday junction resolvase)
VLLFTVRILALDIGEKRIGTAISDESGKIAQGVKQLAPTGSQSLKRKRSKDSIDVVAAQIILQGYLDAQGRQ